MGNNSIVSCKLKYFCKYLVFYKCYALYSYLLGFILQVFMQLSSSRLTPFCIYKFNRFLRIVACFEAAFREYQFPVNDYIDEISALVKVISQLFEEHLSVAFTHFTLDKNTFWLFCDMATRLRQNSLLLGILLS